MSKPVAIARGIAFAFPDVCKTPTPVGDIPIPYPNIAQLDQAEGTSSDGEKELLVGGVAVLLKDAVVGTSTGNEAGSSGGVTSTVTKGPCKLVEASQSVVYGPDGKGLVRFMDRTEQNKQDKEGRKNADGFVLSAFPTVLVGD